MTYHCKLCDSDFTSQSYGGPDICPACDCGIDPKVIKLQNENAQLHTEIAALKAQQNKLAVYATPQAALAIEPPA